MDRLRLYRLALGQPNPDSYLRDLERNGFLKTIDTRSLYLNLFPFSSRSRHAQFASILAEQDKYKLLLSDAERKASQLERMAGGMLLKKLVGQAITSLRKRINGNYDKVIMKPSLRRLLGSLHDFVDVHDKINDRVPAIGYQDDIKRLKQALVSIH